MADTINNELAIRAQMANLLDRLPDIDLATYDEEPASSAADPVDEPKSNNRWGFTFRRKTEDEPKPGNVAGLQGA